MDPARRGLDEACGLDTPLLRGGEYRVFPPARNGQEARWTPQRGLLGHVGLHTPRNGVEK